MKSFFRKEKKNIQIAKYVTTLFVIRMFSMLLGFVANSLVARKLGPVSYGNFKIIVSVSLLLLPLLELGIHSSIGFILANSRDENWNKHIIGAGILITLPLIGIFSSVFILSGFIIFPYLFPNNSGLQDIPYWLISPIASFIMYQMLIYQVSQGTGEVKVINNFYLCNSFAYVVLILFFIFINKISLTYALLAYFVSNILAVAMSIISIHPIVSIKKIIFKKIFQTVKVYGLKVYVTRLTAHIILQIDTLILAAIKGSEEVGVYNAAMLLTFPIIALGHAISLLSFRPIAQDESNFSRYNQFNLLVLVIASIGILLLGNPVVSYIFGKRFIPATELLPFVVASSFMRGLYQVKSSFLASRGYAKELIIASFIMTLVGIITIFPLTKMLGAVGTALSMTITFSVYNIILAFMVNAIRGE